MLKIKLKIKKIFNFLKILFYKKKKTGLILGPIGNYSYQIINNKKKNSSYYFIRNIKSIFFNYRKIIPFINNNGGIVNDSIKILEKKKMFVNLIFILNINHNFFIYKKKKKFFFHKQSNKQTLNNILLKFNNFKKKKINSNSELNLGLNISNYKTNFILPINTNKIKLKDNIFNKTLFILNYKNSIKKKFLLFFINNNIKFLFFIQKYIYLLYKNKNKLFLNCYFKSFRNLIFIMKYFKNKVKILFSGFYNIL